MSTIRVNTIQLNQEGNAAITIANSYNVAISVDGTEKVKFHAAAVGITSNLTVLSGGASFGTTANPGTGAVFATGNITAYYSDKRLKEIIYTIPNALDKVNSLSGVVYKNNDVAEKYGYTSNEEQIGVIAQEVESVLPHAVKLAPFDLGNDDQGNIYSISGENYKTVQYEKLIPLLIEAIKELSAEIEKLKGK